MFLSKNFGNTYMQAFIYIKFHFKICSYKLYEKFQQLDRIKMKELNVIDSAKETVKELMKNNDPSHDWYHVERVWKNAVYIAQQEMILNSELNFDMEIVELAALFHDVVDFKYDHDKNRDLKEIAHDRLNDFFTKHNYPANKIDQIIYIILNISWRKELEQKEKLITDIPFELKIVRDSDRLDAIGAIGIAR